MQKSLNKRIFGFIGSREPSKVQLDLAMFEISNLDPEIDVIVSGCAEGIDAAALKFAYERGFYTFGVVPWAKYELETQKICSKVIVLDQLPAEDQKLALDSVKRLHPGYARLTQGMVKLHARNFIIVRNCAQVFAYPGHKRGMGGTGQGIRICLEQNIALRVFNCVGDELSHESIKLLAGGNND